MPEINEKLHTGLQFPPLVGGQLDQRSINRLCTIALGDQQLLEIF